jgi:putative spermidine/putrescine transport system substrate-binding protein
MRPRRRLTHACLAAGLTLLTRTAHAQTHELIIALPTGGLAAAERATLFKYFTDSTGIRVSASTSDPAAALTSPEGHPPDVLLMRGDRLRAACQANQLAKIDWDALGGPAKFLPQGIQAQGMQECGLGAVIVTTLLAWDRDKFPATPTWQDFWDIAKLPGKRGLHDGVRTTLEIALMADGVAPGDVYRTLRGEDGVDRAFRKLDQLRPYIVWWRDGADAARILGNGEVLLTAAPNGEVARVATAQKRNLGLQWSGSLVSVLSWAIRQDNPAMDQSQAFLKAAANPAIQAELQQSLPYGGMAPGANDHLPPDIEALSSGVPAHLSAGVAVDEAFWQDNLEKLTQRFDAWKK